MSDATLVGSDTSRAVEPAALAAVRARIAARFGLVPSFFMMARAEPPIVESMFAMVEFTYFDAPLPSLWKERLFVYVSRFCAVPYCMARHCGFLVGNGHVAGNPDTEGISLGEAVALLKTPFPDAAARDELLFALRAIPDALERWPDPTSGVSETLLFAAAVVFVMPQEHKPLLAELERVLGARYYNYLMLFLGFIRFAHFWTESHPQLRVEDDLDQLLSEQRALAEWVTNYSVQVEQEVVHAKAELRELQARAAQNEKAVVALREEITARTHDAQVALAESRAKARFMSTLSHELRTPLNAVVGYTELLEAGLGGALDEKGLAYLARIKATARQQQQIIEEVLSFARLEGGRETVRTESVSIDGLLDELRAVITPLAETRGLTFTTRVATAPSRFVTDSGKLRQILLNLLGNAVKFTSTGAIELSVEKQDGALAALVFSVADTGPGIPPDDRERIFEPFTQLEEGKTDEHGGSGLGLAITKRLVDLLHGSIRVQARDGGGSTFVVSLPYERAK